MTVTDYCIEVCEGLQRTTPPTVISVNDLPDWVERHKDSNAGLFASAYIYSTDDPYIGGVLSNLYIDFDSEQNPDKARKEAVAVVKKLTGDYNIPEANINIAFSGMKGFSLTVDHNVFNAECLDYLPTVWKSIVQELTKKLKLQTVDLSIYERRRLWRIRNSRHQKTGLYKIPLTPLELEKLSINKIKELAVKPRELFVKADARTCVEAEALFVEHKIKVEAWLDERKKTFNTAELKTQTVDPPCIKRLLEVGAKKGERNNTTFQLAVYYAGKGLTADEIQAVCQEFALKSDEPLTDHEIRTLVDSAVKGVTLGRYGVGCSSEVLAELCDRDACPFFNAESQTWTNIGEPISFDEWKQTIQTNFAELWPYAEVCASVVSCLLIKDVQPLCLVLQGNPSSGKTTTLNFFKNLPFAHSTDKFTPRAFVSHVAQRSEEELKKIDLLPRIKDKVLITAELSTLFGAKAEELKETFSLLTRVLDGDGLTIDSGVYGTRGYKGEHMFTWLGATTPIPHTVWDLFGNLGARMYFMQIAQKNKTNSSYIADLKQKNSRKKVNACNEATQRFLKGIWRDTRLDWDCTNDSDELLDKVVLLSKVVTRLRGKINVIVKEGYDGEKTYNSEPIVEEPDRCIQALYTLMRGHALIQGRTQIQTDDLPVVIDVALSSAPWDRINAFCYLLNKESVTAKDLMEDLKCARTTAIRSMQTLKLLELVDLQEEPYRTNGGEQTGYVMKLKQEFKWFKSAEFQNYWRLKHPTNPKEEQKMQTLQTCQTTLLKV